MSDRPTANLTLQMSRASDGKFRLRIIDEDSSVLVAEVVLDEAAFANLMSTSQAHAPAEVCTADQYAHVGKTLTTESEKVPSEYVESIYDHAGIEAAVGEYADLRRREVGADTVSIGHHNYGTALHFRTWR